MYSIVLLKIIRCVQMGLMIWLSLCIIYLLRWISCTPSGMCKWTCAEAHIFLCALVNHQKWLKSRCTYIGHPKWQCMYRGAKHPFKTIFLWSLSATFRYGSLARSFQEVDWLTGFPLHFPNKSEKCRHISGWCWSLVLSGYSGTLIWRRD